MNIARHRWIWTAPLASQPWGERLAGQTVLGSASPRIGACLYPHLFDARNRRFESSGSATATYQSPRQCWARPTDWQSVLRGRQPIPVGRNGIPPGLASQARGTTNRTFHLLPYDMWVKERRGFGAVEPMAGTQPPCSLILRVAFSHIFSVEKTALRVIWFGCRHLSFASATLG